MARDKRDEVHNIIDDNFAMVYMAMAMRQLLLLAMVLRAHVCKVVGRCDRLCSDEC